MHKILEKNIFIWLKLEIELVWLTLCSLLVKVAKILFIFNKNQLGIMC